MRVSYRGFWSYVHKDDEADRGRISMLAKDVVAQYEMLTGETIELFLDKDAIEWGDKWREKIGDNLALVAFFIPVMTPRYFMSPECCSELRSFAHSADKLGLKELLLPLHYVNVPSLSEESVENDLLRMVREFHWQDWRDLRYMEVTSEAYRKGVADIAGRLVRANKNAEEANVGGAASEMEKAEGEGDGLGTIDRLARAEEVLPHWVDTIAEITKQVEIIGEVMREGALASNKVSGGRGIFARRIQIVRGVAMKLTGPTDKISMLTNQFEPQLHAIDDLVRIIVELAPAEVEENPDLKQQFCLFIESVRTLSKAAHNGLSEIQRMIESAAPLEKMSRDLRPVVRRLRQALTIMAESRSVSDNWIGLIETSGVDCREFASGVEEQWIKRPTKEQ